tara:strand:- start:36 stop:620 length:585 start_codon:yes stop_codon:yes gene_type:complete
MSEIFIIIAIFGGLMCALFSMIKNSKEGYKSLSEAYRQWNEVSSGTAAEDSDYDTIRREILRKKMERAAPSPLMEKESYPVQPVLKDQEPAEELKAGEPWIKEPLVEVPQIETAQNLELEQDYEEASAEVPTTAQVDASHQEAVGPIQMLSEPKKKSPRNNLLRSRIRKSLSGKREAQVALITGEILARPMALK